MIRAPKGKRDVEAFAIDTRANSNLMKILWVSSRNDGSGDIFPPCFRQDYVWTAKAFRALSKRSPAACPSKVSH